MQDHANLIHSVKEKLKITEEFRLYDKNGWEILEEDCVHLWQDDCIYVCPTSREFNYLALLEMYTRSWKLGSGGFGQVFKLRHKLNKQIVAAKFVWVSEYFHRADSISQIMREAQYLMTLDHKNILKFESAFLIKKEIVIFTEFFAGGELGKFLDKQPKPLSEEHSCEIMTEIVSAIVYVHNKQILHRDLKLENIMLQDEKNPKSIKIIDFGLSSLHSSDEYGHSGTILYSPPELFNGECLKSSNKTDIWALGVILYIMITK